MSKVIRIDTEVFKALQDKAAELDIPFSNADNLLRIILGLTPLKGENHQPVSKQ